MLLRYGLPDASSVLELTGCDGLETERTISTMLDGALVGWRFDIVGGPSEAAVVRSRLIRGGAIDAEITMTPSGEPSAVRVYCGHCHAISVVTQPTVCSGCRTPLTVSGHYSSHHAAYLGEGDGHA